MAKRTINKSKLIRDYITEHPGSGYADISKALAKHGIKTYDIANVFTAMKKKGESPSSGASTDGKPKRGRPPKANAARASVTTSAAPASSGSAYDSALAFIQSAGGVDNAVGILELIRKVLQSNIR